MKKLSLPNEEEIRTHIEEIYARGVDLGKTKAEFHTFLQDKVASLASEFSLIPEKEFVLPGFRGDNRNGYIDVVWAVGSIPIVAIEIDSALREKSVRKLLASNANYLFWVYYGVAPFESLVNSVDIANRVKVLHFPSKFGKFGVKPESPKSTEKIESKPSKSYNFAEIRTKHPNAYEKWSSEQDQLLKEYFEKGLSVSEMASNLQRKPGAIRSRIKKFRLR